ncbi:MAG: hypothetical protein DRN91_08485 [Candidatus Alkanophagales archaeon]|nr:MAG: hypothetical protein DRN91_08485 [Candidatus Alkanophagales archaeon]
MQELMKQKIVGYCYCGGALRKLWRGELVCERCGAVYTHPPHRVKLSLDDLEHAINSAISALQAKGIAPTLQRIYAVVCWTFGVNISEARFQEACTRLGLL